MEGELWKIVVPIIYQIGQQWNNKYKQYSDSFIVEIYLWAVLHDRSVSWACVPTNWPDDQRWEQRPSRSRMSERLASESVRQFLRELELRLRSRSEMGWCKWIDGLPLPVGGSTEDPDARCGRGAGLMAKGYKLHAICDSRGGIDAWQVTSLNVNEQVAARSLVPQLEGSGYIVGDGQYDSNYLYDLAGQYGFQLVAPHRKDTKLGHVRHSPYRLTGRRLLEGHFGQALLHNRAGIDRFFGNMGGFAGGLGPLPHWVRRLHRVRLWVQGKIILNAARLLKNKRLTA
jgi:hypothetical protein